MIHHNKKPGYILALTLLILSTIMVLVTSIANRTLGQRKTSRLFVQREQAQVLAQSGIEIAQSLITPSATKKEKAKESTSKDAQKPATDTELQDLVERLLTNLNTWHIYKLQESVDGIDGELGVYITAEEGKINLNKLYDFKTKKFVTESSYDGRKVLQGLADRLKPQLGDTNVVDMFERVVQKREGPFNDATELLAEKAFAKLNTFMWPKPETSALAFMDIVTSERKNHEIQPLLLSPSLQNLLQIKQKPDDKDRKQKIKEIASKIKPEMNWAQEWDTLMQPFVGKKYADIPIELKNIFAPKFEATTFSVVSYGKVGAITRMVCAIIEKKSVRDQRATYAIRKLYWL